MQTKNSFHKGSCFVTLFLVDRFNLDNTGRLYQFFASIDEFFILPKHVERMLTVNLYISSQLKKHELRSVDHFNTLKTLGFMNQEKFVLTRSNNFASMRNAENLHRVTALRSDYQLRTVVELHQKMINDTLRFALVGRHDKPFPNPLLRVRSPPCRAFYY